MRSLHARLAALAAGLLLALAAALAGAQDLAAVPKPERRVTDLTGTLTPDQIAQLDAKLAAFERTKGSQIAVLMLATTKPESIEQYSIRVADAWKVGRAKVDDGLILVVAKDDRRLRIEVGYGLEGVVPDAVASRVIREIIGPRFQAGDYYGGIAAGTDRLIRLVEGEPLPPPANPRGAPQGEALESYFVVLLVFTIIVGGLLTRVLGRFLGAAATGGAAGFLALAIAGTLLAAIGAGVLAFFFSLALGGGGGVVTRGRRGGHWGGPSGGWGGGTWSGGGGGGGWSGGGWSGGGGGFGGGGASGSWGD